jgi:undecaprenyl diphosphate synthase
MNDLDAIAKPGTPERVQLDLVRPEALPHHIAVIMDGNGRWAQARGLPRVEGHRAGREAVKTTVETAARLGISVVTLYAFSTENWKRPAREVGMLWRLLTEFIDAELDTFKQENLRFRTIGDTGRLDGKVRRYLQRAVNATSSCTGTLIQIALNYSGRHEITRLVQGAVAEAAAGRLRPGAVDEDWISRHLDTKGMPDPDLLIRTSGEQRISNFLLWQVAYSEIYFSKVLWPDFGTRELLEAIVAYQKRDRRYGGIKEAAPAQAEVQSFEA